MNSPRRLACLQERQQIIDAIRCMSWGISAIAVTGRESADGVEGMKLFVSGALDRAAPRAKTG